MIHGTRKAKRPTIPVLMTCASDSLLTKVSMLQTRDVNQLLSPETDMSPRNEAVLRSHNKETDVKDHCLVVLVS